MKEEPAPETCPSCGAERAEGGAPGDDSSPCAACGSPWPPARKDWTQPVFERTWEGGEEGRKGFLSRVRRGIESAGETAVAIVTRPESSFREFRLTGGYLAPLVFSVLLAGPSLLLNVLMKSHLPGSVFSGELVVSVPLALALVFVAPPVYIYLRAQLLHLALVLTGYMRRPFEVTFRAVGYSNASLAPALILPFAGDFLFLLAGAVVEATAIRLCHDLSVRQAVLAEVLPAAVLATSLAAVLTLGILWWSQGGG